MSTECPTCGAAASAGKFCGSCGNKVPDASQAATPERVPRRDSPIKALGWPLTIMGLVTVLLVGMAAYSKLRPSEVSLTQIASRVSSLECTSDSGTMQIGDGTWKYTSQGGAISQGTFDVQDDAIEIKEQSESGGYSTMTIRGGSGVFLDLNTPVSITYGDGQSVIRLASGTASTPAGECRRV